MKDTPATKSDIQRLEGNIRNLDSRTERLAVEIVRSHERMDRLEDGLKNELRQLNSQVLGALDTAVGRMETLWRESAIIPRILDEHGIKLRDHETRLGRLEAR